MSQQDQWQAHPSYPSMPGRQLCPNREANDSSTFVNPLHEGSSQSFSPYVYSPETAIPPPPPGIYSPLIFQPKRNTRYQIALAVLIVLVVALGSLEIIQLAAHTPLTTYPSGSAGSKQAGITSAQRAMTPLKTVPVQTLTPGTIKENRRLTCSGCNNPVLTTINSITVDTTNLRTVWTVTLNNESGAQQIDYFTEFSLQDPLGNTYEGTGELNTDFFLPAGQSAFKSEIFSFLPRPGVSYTLVARLGISGITYDPHQLTF
jgi:hypothetical protein